MNVHPVANLFPEMTAEEYAALRDDIKVHGVREPVWKWHDLLIDGRHRMRACNELGIPCPARAWHGDEIGLVAFVVSLNLNRRHLDESQRGMVAAKLETMRHGGNRNGQDANLHLARSKAASLLNVSERTVATAKKVIDHGTSELVAAVESGRLSVSTAADLADADADEQRELIDSGDEKAIIKRAREIKNRRAGERKSERDEKRKAAAREAARALPPEDDQWVRHGDFRFVAKEIPDQSIDLIFTDPPYDRGSLPLYGDLAAEAARVLKDGGSMVCYLGQYQIHEVCRLVTPHLRLWWTLCCLHTGPAARMTEYGIVVKWKPMLWFVKGTRGDKQTMVDDLIESTREKDTHEWQQGITEAAYCIERLTLPGDRVFDPFCGGGTTAAAAKALGRKWLTCDTDETSVHLARKRIHDARRAA